MIQLPGVAALLEAPTAVGRRPGLRELEQAADEGNAHAQTLFGWLLESGALMEGPNHSRAVDYFEKAAPRSADAAFSLADCLRLGSGVPMAQPTRAVEMYRLALDQGHVRAAFWLGYMHEHGLGVPANQLEADRLYCRGAMEFGCARAQTAWAVHLLTQPEDSMTTVRNNNALDLLRAAARQGHADAHLTLGMLFLGHLQSVNVPQDEALARFHLDLAANMAQPMAQFLLAGLLLRAPENDNEQQRAAQLLEAAVAAEVPPAMEALADLLETGTPPFAADKVRARRLRQHAAQLSSSSSS